VGILWRRAEIIDPRRLNVLAVMLDDGAQDETSSGQIHLIANT